MQVNLILIDILKTKVHNINTNHKLFLCAMVSKGPILHEFFVVEISEEKSVSSNDLIWAMVVPFVAFYRCLKIS